MSLNNHSYVVQQYGIRQPGYNFPIGFDEALEYKKAHGQYLRRNQWQDLTIQVYI